MTAAIKHMSEDGATQITQKTWPDAFAGIGQTPRKFAFESLSDRVLANMQVAINQVGVNDGFNMLRLAADSATATLSAPYGLTLTLGPTADGGVWAATGTRGYKVSALNALGETVASIEKTINVDDVTKRVTVSWTAIPGATSYNIFRTDTPGTYGASSLRANVAGGPFIDNGTAPSAGTPKLVNTTAGWNTTLALSGAGDGGVWGATGLKFYRVTAVDVNNIILAASLEASVNVDVATKRVTVSWLAIPGAVNYKVYRSTVSGSYVSPALRTTTAALSFIDDGSATSAGALTEAPSYGVPPAVASFGTAALAIGNVAINQQIFYWVNRVVPGATSEVGNPRLATINVKET